MERELWLPLYRLLIEMAASFHQKYVRYQPWVLVAVLLWAALHDRPIFWACQRRHWSTTTLRPTCLPSFGRQLHQCRTAIERCFGKATSFGGGLAPLPAWVRGWARVRTWVWAKLVINAIRILET